MIRLQAFTLSLLALLALVACSSTRAAQVSAPPVVTAPVISAVDAAIVVDAATAASPDVAIADDASSEQDPPDPHLVRLRALAADDDALRAGIDAARGVTVIRYIEAPPSGRGREDLSNRHLCGATVTRALPSLRSALSAAIEQAGASESFSCDGDVCTVPGMEYQPAFHLYFVSSGDALTLEAIAQVSEATMGEQWMTRATAYVTRSLTAARAHPCAQTGR